MHKIRAERLYVVKCWLSKVDGFRWNTLWDWKTSQFPLRTWSEWTLCIITPQLNNYLAGTTQKKKPCTTPIENIVSHSTRKIGIQAMSRRHSVALSPSIASMLRRTHFFPFTKNARLFAFFNMFLLWVPGEKISTGNLDDGGHETSRNRLFLANVWQLRRLISQTTRRSMKSLKTIEMMRDWRSQSVDFFPQGMCISTDYGKWFLLYRLQQYFVCRHSTGRMLIFHSFKSIFRQFFATKQNTHIKPDWNEHIFWIMENGKLFIAKEYQKDVSNNRARWWKKSKRIAAACFFHAAQQWKPATMRKVCTAHTYFAAAFFSSLCAKNTLCYAK